MTSSEVVEAEGVGGGGGGGVGSLGGLGSGVENLTLLTLGSSSGFWASGGTPLLWTTDFSSGPAASSIPFMLSKMMQSELSSDDIAVMSTSSVCNVRKSHTAENSLSSYVLAMRLIRNITKTTDFY